MTPRLRTILTELRRELESLYGDRLVKLVLFGSQARGDSESGSDIDVLVVLEGPVQPSQEVHRASPLTAAISLKHDVVISCVYASAERYETSQGPLLTNVQAEGIPV